MTRAVGIVAATAVAGATLLLAGPAAAVGERDSSITVEWGTGNVTVGPDATATAQEVKDANPDHAALTSDGNENDAGSGHWDDFRNLKVTVGQTTGLLDQGVQLRVEGMKETYAPFFSINEGTSNFLQVMQCWGDPSAEDFRKTCQWGGYSGGEVGGEGPVVPGIGTPAFDLNRGPYPTVDLPDVVDGNARFRSVTGEENKDQTYVSDTGYIQSWRGLGDFFTSSSSNEIPFLPIDGDGTVETSIGVQSAATQPYLGCGAAAPRGAGERCWLVIVPRGEYAGGLQGAPTGACDGRAATPEGSNDYGVWNRDPLRKMPQNGSPISTTCSYWDNRVVVPLDFLDPFQTCPGGAAARPVIGTELTASVMSSWQSSLCKKNGATFALSTNSGDLVRSQLLQGQTGLATVSLPVTPDTIGSTSPSLLADTTMRYAPLANTSLAIGFVAAEKRMFEDSIFEVDQIRLTPRLIAKMLTQSFQYDIPWLRGGETVGESLGTLKGVSLTEDEEWQALGNPHIPMDYLDPPRAPWVVVGPQGDDVNQLLWQYVLSDADAVDFLRGNPDPWGNTVNPYYLPPGSEKAAGGGYDLLSRALANFPKADQSVWPEKEKADLPVDEGGTRGLRLDSVGFSPYSKSLADNAKRISAGDSRRVGAFDRTKLIGGTNIRGDWATATPMVSGTRRLLLGPTGASDASQYNLQTAELALPSSKKTTKAGVAERTFVASTDETVAATIAAQRKDPKTGIASTDMTALTAAQYPLATTVYAAADLNADVLTADARQDYANLLEYAAGPGNQKTGTRGTLPPGYVPLSVQQIEATKKMAAELRIMPGEEQPAPGAVTSPQTNGQQPPATGTPSTTTPTPAEGPQVSTTADGPTEATGAIAGSVGLGGALLGGVAGLAAAPFLLRRREVGG